jgi:glycosyltransferase involved in cell wall biosynthesis
MRVLYLPLERYHERYTEMLTEWSVAGFRASDVQLVPVCEFPLASIKSGRVLDGVGRGIAATSAVKAALLALANADSFDAVFVEDLFTPGIEALFYARALSGIPNVPIWSRNYAQSVDPSDFTYAMRSWMRHYEQMCHDQLAGVFVACEAHKEMLASASMAERVHVVGLPFDEAWVRRKAGPMAQWKNRRTKIVYASRFDDEKNPLFMLEVARHLRKKRSDIEIVVCSGAATLRASDFVTRAIKHAAKQKVIDLKLGLTKRAYYGELKQARVHLNTATQDFISFTALEASALQVTTVAPCLRSFPEFLSPAQLYVPFDIKDAVETVLIALDEQPPFVFNPAAHHSLTFARMAKLLAA